jgi:hypothetical protein
MPGGNSIDADTDAARGDHGRGASFDHSGPEGDEDDAALHHEG